MSVFLFSRHVYDEMVAKGDIIPKEEVAPPTVPMDFNWARVSTTNSGADCKMFNVFQAVCSHH